MKCSYCPEPAILTAAKSYCIGHIENFESQFFERAVMAEFKTKDQMEKFFIWAFGTRTPRLSDLQKWHDRIPRPENPPEKWILHGIYVEPQNNYIKKIVKEYRGMNYAQQIKNQG